VKVVQEIGRVRKATVLRKFLSMLQTGANSGAGAGGRHHHHGARGGAPSGDVVKFAGNVLGWLHQCIANESDALAPLFEDAVSCELTRADVLDQVFEGVCRHLRQRIEAALAEQNAVAPGRGAAAAHNAVPSDAAIVGLFRLEGILGFYGDTTEGLLGPSAALTLATKDLRLDVMRQFFEALQAAMRQLSAQCGSAPADLATPAPVAHVLQLLRAMLDSVQQSFVPHDARESEFSAVLGAIADPIVAMTSSTDVSLARGVEAAHDEGDAKHAAKVAAARCVFRINVYCSLLATMLAFDFTAGKQQKLTSLLEAEVAAFVDANSAAIAASCGFEERLAALEAGEATAAALGETMQGFYAYVYNAGALPIPLLECVQVLRIRERCGGDVTRRVCDRYAALVAAVEARYSEAEAKEIVYHAPQQMRVLLDVA
jgi:hypothetical protein